MKGLLFFAVFCLVIAVFGMVRYTSNPPANKAYQSLAIASNNWDPDAGVVPALTENAQVKVSSNAKDAAKVLDKNKNTLWQSSASFPNGFMTRSDLNLLLGQVASKGSSPVSQAANATDGNVETDAKVSLQGKEARVEFPLTKKSSLRSISLRLSHYQQAIQIFAVLADGSAKYLRNYEVLDYNKLRRLPIAAAEVQAIRLVSKTDFVVREIAAMASAPTEFVELDLGRTQEIGMIETRHWAGSGTATATRLLLSEDGKRWTKVADLNPEEVHAVQTLLMPAKQGRFIRLEHELVAKDWNKVTVFEINAYDAYGPYGKMPAAKQNPTNFRDLLGVNGIWGWGHNKYSKQLKPGEGPDLYRRVASHARNYHFMTWDVKDPDHKPDFEAMAAGKGSEVFEWLDWDREYSEWKASGLKVQTTVKFGEIEAKLWDDPYQAGYNYGYAFAKHFGPTTGNGLVDAMEIGNEPWYCDAEFYRQVFHGMAKGAKAADANIFVLPCALQAGFPSNEVDGLFRNYMGARLPAETAPYIDGINVHYYSWISNQEGKPICVQPEHPYTSMRGILNDIRFRDKNLPGLPIYLSELGWDSNGGGEDCTHSECVSERAQALYAVRSVLMMARLGINRMTWYFYANEDKGSSLFTRCGLTSAPRSGYVEKRSFRALESLVNLIGDLHFLELIQEDENAWVYVLGDKTGKASHLVAWRPVAGDDQAEETIHFEYAATAVWAKAIDGIKSKAKEKTLPKIVDNQWEMEVTAIPVIVALR